VIRHSNSIFYSFCLRIIIIIIIIIITIITIIIIDSTDVPVLYIITKPVSPEEYQLRKALGGG
jgi:hypothetical protein